MISECDIFVGLGHDMFFSYQMGEWTSEERADAKSCFDGVSKNGKHIAQEIEKLINKVQKGGLAIVGKPQTNKLRWLRIAKRAKKLQELLRVQKTILGNFIAVRMLYDTHDLEVAFFKLTMYRECSARHGLQVTRLEMQMDMMIKHQLSLMEDQKSSMQRHIDEQKQGDSLSVLSHDTDQQTILSKWSTAASRNATSSLSVSMKTSTLCHHPHLSREKNAPLFSSPEVPSATALSCLEDCRCQCHFRSVVRSPKLLSNCLGNIVLGFSNLPWALSRLSQCDEQTCRRVRSPETEIKYFIPYWFSYAIANFKVDLAIRFLPLNIRVRSLNTIPYDSPIFVCTQEGDQEGIMKLLQSGAASLYDVDPYGLGLLYVSTCSLYFTCNLHPLVRILLLLEKLRGRSRSENMPIFTR